MKEQGFLVQEFDGLLAGIADRLKIYDMYSTLKLETSLKLESNSLFTLNKATATPSILTQRL